jgi:hypothetical protein
MDCMGRTGDRWDRNGRMGDRQDRNTLDGQDGGWVGLGWTEWAGWVIGWIGMDCMGRLGDRWDRNGLDGQDRG